MRARRKQYEGNDAAIIAIIKDGTARANILAEETLALAKEAAGLGFFKRTIALH